MRRWITRSLDACRYRFRVLAARHPSLFFRLYGLSPANRRVMVRRDTRIVIEGFPRSANTFAVVAFRQAQEEDFHIAHHLHAQGQVVRAVEWGIPVCLLIRSPVDAVRSLVLKLPYIRPHDALRAYAEFYSDVYPLRDRVVVATYEEVTTDLGAVIARLNSKFGTHFRMFSHTTVNVERAFAFMRTNRGKEIRNVITDVNMPVAGRSEVKNSVDLTYCRDAADTAERVYRLFVPERAVPEPVRAGRQDGM
jgi:hypothetical protein